jgi:hypothetical protein
MQDSKIHSMTLLTWTLQIWSDHRRGLNLTGHNAAIAYCMEHHPEWRNDWNSVPDSNDDRTITNRIIHIHNDAAVLTQLQTGDSAEPKKFHEALLEKGFTEFESIHTLGLALSEERDYGREHKEEFNYERYIERADRYVKQALSRPNLTRLAKAKAY